MEQAQRAEKGAPSLARSHELQAALVNLLQNIRQAPAILHVMDLDELRQLATAADTLLRQTELAADILIALQARQVRSS